VDKLRRHGIRLRTRFLLDMLDIHRRISPQADGLPLAFEKIAGQLREAEVTASTSFQHRGRDLQQRNAKKVDGITNFRIQALRNEPPCSGPIENEFPN